MKRGNKIQSAIATGRFTLPVVAISVLIIWMISIKPWTDIITMFIYAITGYLLIELNTAFSLIKVRTTLHVSIYMIATAVCMFLHDFKDISLIPLLFVYSLFCFLNSYEHSNPTNTIFSSLFFLGTATILFPYMIFYTPLLLLSMVSFRCMNIKSFFAALVGIIAPYWIFFAYTFLTDQLNLFLTTFKEMIKISPFNFTDIKNSELISSIIIFSLSFITSLSYFSSSYMDKIRSRVAFTFIIIIELWSLILWLLNPSHTAGIMEIQIICYSILTGRIFAVTKNRFSNIFLIITILCFVFLAIYNIWTQFFNFL